MKNSIPEISLGRGQRQQHLYSLVVVAVVLLLVLHQSVVTTQVDAFVSRNSRGVVKPSLNTFSTTTTSTSTTSLGARASRIDDWVLTRDGRIEGTLRDSGDLVKTSVLADPTVAAKNVVVTTSSGSRYKLMKPKAAVSSSATSSDRSTRPLLSEALERFQRQQQQQGQGRQDETVVSTSPSTDDNKLINPTTAVLGTSAAVALGATIGSGVLGDGTKNSFNLQQSLSKQSNQIVQSVGSTFQGVVQDKKLPSVSLPNVDLPNVGVLPKVDLPGVPDLSLPGAVNDFIDDNLGQLKNKFKKSPTPAITPYVVKLPYLEEKIETAEQKQQATSVPAPQTPAPTQAAQQKAAQEKAAQKDFQRKLREAEEAAAREKKLEAEAAAAKAKAAAEAENKLLEMEAQQAAMKQQQAANEFATKLAQAEAAASVAKEAPQQQAKPTAPAPAKSPSASQTSSTFEKWQAAQRVKAQQKPTIDPIKPVPATSLKPPAKSKAATATTSKLSTYEEWQIRQRALREDAAANAAYRPIVPNAPPGSVGRMTSSEEAFIALAGVGISAATLGSVFTRKGSWDETQATPASEISNQQLRPRAPRNPPPKKKMIEDLPKKLQQPPPLPVQPQVVQQQQQQFTPPPPPEAVKQVPPPPPTVVAPPTPEPAPAPAAEVITSPTHEIARPDSESKAAVASSSDGNYLQALGGGSGSSPKKSYSPFGAKKPAAPSAGSLYAPPGGGGTGDSADSVSSFSFTNQDSVSSMSDWSPPIPPAGSLSSKMKPSAYSPFGGGKKPVAASSRDTLYTPPSTIEPVDSLSSSSSPSLSEVAPSLTAEDTMFFTNGPAVNGDAEQLAEGTNDVYENTNGYEYEASSDRSSSNDDYTVQPTTAGDPIPYTAMPGSSFGGAAVVKPSSYSPFGSKPKASSSSNDSLYGPPP
eukprot:CAMPEP_0113492866 /NCGR_PEP_ID=MMETSP0014_2-20120614/28298_1 /TAXON_ID=2857 /ORGANISM="Nitzschia sp." /LENGTH=920 /DNA_ID=CAMNT_0000386713 /DNA_START=311 /DNA_END=3073 /DNA_ORIENTATION=+ /assembly_acc=CAM_ASM_000159